MVATYELEANHLLIDKRRTKYALLTDEDSEACKHSEIRWCATRSPIYFVSLSKLCIISLFFANFDEVQEYCKVSVTLNNRLPMALALSDSQWFIATLEPMQLSVVCETNQSQVTTHQIKPPLQIFTLPEKCTASNKHLL